MTEATAEALLEILDQAEQYINAGRLGDGVDLLEDNRKAFEMHSDQTIFGKYLLKLGYLFLLRSRWNEAREYYSLAVELVKEHKAGGDTWDQLAQEGFLGLGKIHWRMGEYLDAENYLEKGILVRDNEDIHLAKLLIEMGNVKGERGDMNSAVEHYRRSIAILENLDEPGELTRAYNNISDTLAKSEEYAEAVEFAEKCVKLAQDTNNKRQEGFGYLTGAEALVKMGDIPKAREFYQCSQEALEETDETYVQGCLMLLLGMIETEVDNYRDARQAFEEAKELLEETDIQYYMARVYEEYGHLFQKMGNYSQARGLMEDALEILREHRCLAEIKHVKERLKEIEAAESAIPKL